MHRAAMIIAAAFTALALAGCTTSPNQTSGAASSETVEATPATTPTTDVDTDGPRATESLDHLLTTLNTVYRDNADQYPGYTGDCNAPFETLEEFRECSPDDPVAYLDTIESPQDGELIITLMPEAWGGGEYDPDQVFTVPYLAGNLHSYIGRHTDGPLKVSTKTSDGQYQATQGRLPQTDSSDAPASEAEF